MYILSTYSVLSRKGTIRLLVYIRKGLRSIMCVLNPGNRYRSYATQDSWCAARRLEEHAVGQLKAHVGRRVTDYYRVSYLYSRRDLGEVVGVVAAGGGAAGAVPCVVGGALCVLVDRAVL